MQDHEEPPSGPEQHAAAQAALKNRTIGAACLVALLGALGLVLIVQTEQGLGAVAVFSYGVALVHASVVMVVAAGASSGHGMIANLSAILLRQLAHLIEVLLTFEGRAAERMNSLGRQLMEAIDSLSELRRQVAGLRQEIVELRRIVTDHDARMSAAEQQHRKILTERAEAIGTAIHATEDELHPRRDGREHN